MPRRNQIRRENLVRLMTYMLAYRPDEFGLVPDPEGYVSFKELLWAIHEEEGMGYVQRGHINEILMGKERDTFQTDGSRIRALDRHWTIEQGPSAQGVPRILYTSVRRRAYPKVLRDGLRSSGGKYIVLAGDREMAQRIGRRRDPHPVVLQVRTREAQKETRPFLSFGKLYLAEMVPAPSITGPPLPKEKEKGQRGGERRTEAGKSVDFEAGTFFLEMNKEEGAREGLKRGKKRKGWKEQARKGRKQKRGY
ncbi:MAG: RNA 2'-phosphotransferase [Deltaproteobacteria bacterium]|nr:RNA 2'-phosphotransferase [Deltaproteobacteria bacterium]MBW2136446.1 RNA 2'-phosphotransferase [Deltaproteobacteria bacterium]